MKKCPLCNGVMEDHLTICLDCEGDYEVMSTVEKLPKGHVIDGNDWWRVVRTKQKKGA